MKAPDSAHRREQCMFGYSLWTRQSQRVDPSEAGIGGRKGAPRRGCLRVQSPLVQVLAAEATGVNTGQDAAMCKIEQRLKLFSRQPAQIREVHLSKLGNIQDELSEPVTVDLPQFTPGTDMERFRTKRPCTSRPTRTTSPCSGCAATRP